MKIIAGLMLLASLCLATAGSVPAQPAAPTAPTETPRPGPPADAFGRTTPRGAVLGYLAAMRDRDVARAAEYLDLRRLPRSQRESQGAELARQLKVVLDQNVSLDPDVMSDAPEGRRDDEMPPALERLTTIHTEKGTVDVVLERVRRDDGALVWKFSAATIARVPALYDEFGRGPLGDVLPSVLFEQRLLQIALWQWIGLLLLVVIAYSVASLLGLAFFRLLRLLLGRFRTTIDDRFFEATIGPVRLGVGLALFSSGHLLLALPVPVAGVFATVEKVAALVSVTWLLLRIIDVVGELTTVRLIGRGHVAATSVVPLGRKTVKVVVFALGFIAVLQNVGVNVTGLLAGLGIGGLAIALAAQKTVENLFGGIALTVDQPVRIGDFCRFGGTTGFVEEVGLRSTRIRTLDRSVVSIPNAEFSSLHLENLSKRDRILIRTVIGLRYETTPDQLRYVLVQIRAMLYAHPKIHPEPLWTRFVNFGPSTLDVEVFAYATTGVQKEFFAIREDIYLRIMDIVRESGTGFAFPSQTMYVRRDGPLDDEKRRTAEAQVRVWRGEGELGLPEFSEQRIAALARTLEYPPEGAASRTG